MGLPRDRSEPMQQCAAFRPIRRNSQRAAQAGCDPHRQLVGQRLRRVIATLHRRTNAPAAAKVADRKKMAAIGLLGAPRTGFKHGDVRWCPPLFAELVDGVLRTQGSLAMATGLESNDQPITRACLRSASPHQTRRQSWTYGPTCPPVARARTAMPAFGSRRSHNPH